MTAKVRLVVAGAGAFGREHLRLLAGVDGAEIAGIADPDPAALARAGHLCPAAERGAEAAAMVTRLRPAGLIVATPAAAHVPLALSALEQGIPVLVEKPVASTAADAERLAAAQARGGFVLPGHVLRFSEPHRRFVALARSPAIGTILSVTARRHRDESHAGRYREDPVLMTMIHDIDLALWITGAPPVEVLAQRRPPGTSRSETLMTGATPGGPVWRLSTAWTFPSGPCPPDRIEVVGERGSVELEDGGGIRSYGPERTEIDLAREDPDGPLRAELDYFVDCIRRGRKPAAVTLDDAIAGLRTAEAVLASLQCGRVVPCR